MNAFPQFTLADIYDMTLPQVKLWAYLAATGENKKTELLAHHISVAMLSRQF